MKKIFLQLRLVVALVVGVLSLFQGTAVFAATTTVEPAISALFGFNRWLMANNNAGVNYINSNFEQAYHQAKKWDTDAQIGFVEITYLQPGPAKCVLEFGSVNKPKEVFKVECIDPTKINIARGYGVKIPSTLTSANFFDVPVVKLRAFVVQMFTSAAMMQKVRDQMGGASQTQLDFTLSKQGNDSLWKWGVTDGRGRGLHISVDSMSASPELVFEPQ